LKLYGRDFTCAPGKKKPITCAECRLTDGLLAVDALHLLRDFAEFEAFLNQPGPWVAAMDFPFSLPAKWLETMKWSQEWAKYVQDISELFPSRADFANCIRDYRTGRSAGDKYYLRPIDKLAGACSPMMVDYTPVGKMFFEGARRLLNSDVSVLPFVWRNPQKVAVEGYPARLARRFAGQQGYKSDQPKRLPPAKQAAQRQARQAIIAGITSERLALEFGFKAQTPVIQDTGAQDEWIADASGDKLDAVLCAIQAAWAYTRKDQGYGIPAIDAAQEGWIADPAFFSQGNAL
jgi:hypothetical protein